MIFGKAPPPFIKKLGSYWDRVHHTEGYKELASYMSDGLFVALDLEGWVQSVNEIGVAILQTGPAKSLLSLLEGDIDSFKKSNELEAHTFTIKERLRDRIPGAPKYGDIKIVRETQAAGTLREIILSRKVQERSVVLVGYGMYTEFDWMTRTCPDLLTCFDHWVDLQELVEQNCGHRLGLMKLMAVLAGQPSEQASRNGHRAAVDTVRMLAAASRLVGGEPLDYKPAVTAKPCSQLPRGWKKAPFKARITAADGGLLPACFNTPRQLAAHFAEYEVRAVLMDVRQRTPEELRVWWLSMRSQAALDVLAADIDGSALDGRELKVERVIAPWVARYGSNLNK